MAMAQSISYERSGEWLKLPAETLAGFAGAAVRPLEAGSHPHHVRQWLLALGLFPEKWLNRLFSVGGIRMEGDRILLRTFVPADASGDAMLRLLHADGGGGVPRQGQLQSDALHMDDWCIVLDKPAGMPVHPSAPGQRGTLDEEAARISLLRGDSLPAKHIHRLDDDTAGPVLYARNELAQLRLDEAMRTKAIGRQYVALVQGSLRQSRGTINEPIGKDRHHKSRRRVSPGGEHAVTQYETVERYNRATLVRLWLETGRTHQIRVHMSHIGHPLVGDTLYGGSDSKLRHQALRGERLTFAHPWTGEELSLAAKEPDWFAEARERYASL